MYSFDRLVKQLWDFCTASCAGIPLGMQEAGRSSMGHSHTCAELKGIHFERPLWWCAGSQPVLPKGSFILKGIQLSALHCTASNFCMYQRGLSNWKAFASDVLHCMQSTCCFRNLQLEYHISFWQGLHCKNKHSWPMHVRWYFQKKSKYCHGESDWTHLRNLAI